MAIVAQKISKAKKALLRFKDSRSEKDFNRLRKIVEPQLTRYVEAMGVGTVEQVFDAVWDRIGEYDPEKGAWYWLMLVAQRAIAWHAQNPNSLRSGPAKLDLDALLSKYRIPESDRHNFRLLQAGIIRDPQFRRKLDGEYAGCYQAMLDKLSEPFAHLYK